MLNLEFEFKIKDFLFVQSEVNLTMCCQTRHELL